MQNRKMSFSRRILVAGVTALACSSTGCFHWPWAKKNADDGWGTRAQAKANQDLSPSRVSGELTQAHALFKAQDWSKAESRFHDIAENTKNSPAVAEEARFYEAECLRNRGRLPMACDTYSKMLHDFPSGAYKEQAVRKMYDIAVLWLKDTDREMVEYKEKVDGKRYLVRPAIAKVNFDQATPTIDAEGRALQALEIVHYSDITGPLAPKALFLCGYIKFFREDYKEADHYFTQLTEMHKDSDLAPRALELGIICKTLATGGPDYDGRKAAEARMLIDTALKNYPQIANDKEKVEALTRQMVSIQALQAEKDIRRAEFYERTKHPGSAYFMYEIVRRRNPGTKYEKLANEKMNQLKAEMDKNPDKTKSPDGLEGLLDSTRKRWNQWWGLETPLEKSEAKPTESSTPPVGDRSPQGPKPLPANVTGPGSR